MNQVIIIIFMILLGSLLALQGAVNSNLGKILEHPLHAAIVSFAIGFLALIAVALISKVGMPDTTKILQAPKVLLIGGFLGAIYVSTVIMIMPKIGVANVVLATLCGQIVLSMILDHYGAFGVPKQLINSKRVIGSLLVFSGLLLINYKK